MYTYVYSLHRRSRGAYETRRATASLRPAELMIIIRIIIIIIIIIIILMAIMILILIADYVGLIMTAMMTTCSWVA